MHEYAVTRSIIDIVIEEAQKVNAEKILEIKLAIGDLSTILDDSVQMYFDIISEGTKAQGARLVFNRIPAQFHCTKCERLFIKPRCGFECPDCGSLGKPTEKGKEFFIESIEIE